MTAGPYADAAARAAAAPLDTETVERVRTVLRAQRHRARRSAAPEAAGEQRARAS